eukprot:363516-Chlamydomonas_euryale.AAC.17
MSAVALPLSSPMLSPEWPPSSPSKRSVCAWACAGAASVSTGTVARQSPPPAHPTVSSPHSSVSLRAHAQATNG